MFRMIWTRMDQYLSLVMVFFVIFDPTRCLFKGQLIRKPLRAVVGRTDCPASLACRNQASADHTGLYPCCFCLRTFSPDRLAKHQRTPKPRVLDIIFSNRFIKSGVRCSMLHVWMFECLNSSVFSILTAVYLFEKQFDFDYLEVRIIARNYFSLPGCPMCSCFVEICFVSVLDVLRPTAWAEVSARSQHKMHGPSSTLRGSVIRRSQYTTQTSGSNMLCARSFPSFPKRKIWSIFV